MQSFVLCKIPGYSVELDRFSLCLVGGVFSTHLQILPLTPLFSLINAGCGLFVNCGRHFIFLCFTCRVQAWEASYFELWYHCYHGGS